MATPYFDDGRVQLWLGDCREILPQLNVFEPEHLIIADPPYGETRHAWDAWPEGWLNAVAEVGRSLWCFGTLRMFGAHWAEYAAAGFKLSHDVIWQKHNPSGPDADRFRRIHEQIAFFYRGAWRDVWHDPQRVTTGVVEHGRVVNQGAKAIGHRGAYASSGWRDDGTRLMTSVIAMRSMHRMGNIAPTEKPVGLLAPLIRYGCPREGLVIDPFAGSGSTLAAAISEGRSAIGIEADEAQIERAAKRLSQGALDVGAAS
ncbi:MAG TPA: site-specific DNA-methyltransferase [Burkholderiaceae bacterium]